MTTDIKMLESIPDAKPVRVFLPITGRAERYRANCVLDKTGPREFVLLFTLGMLPTQVIDTTGICLVTVDMGGPTLSLEARIKEIVGEQMLRMFVEKTFNHEQMREFFRVDAAAKVTSSSFQPEFFAPAGDPWSITGKSIDISGSGVLVMFTQLPPEEKQVRLEITLPTNEASVISVLAHPVRTLKLAENHYEVAYHFDDISMDDRDKIIGCCLVIQRKLLRLKVQVRES